MKKVAIIYASHDGHTQKICDTLAAQLDTSVDLLAVEDCDETILETYDVFVFGAAIRYGKHLKPMVDYLMTSRDFFKANSDKKTAFFSVNLTARKDNRNTPETSNYVKKLIARLNWQPDELDVFAGKLNYPRYRFIDKHMIRFIMWVTKGDTDLTTVKEYTDWDRVAAFSERLKMLMS